MMIDNVSKVEEQEEIEDTSTSIEEKPVLTVKPLIPVQKPASNTFVSLDQSRPISNTEAEGIFVMPELSEGMKVVHKGFGEGTIVKLFVNEKKITVKFADGEKTFVTDEKHDYNAFKRGFLTIITE